jgi:hypothetical protein
MFAMAVNPRMAATANKKEPSGVGLGHVGRGVITEVGQ